jgi:hypothetical protein
MKRLTIGSASFSGLTAGVATSGRTVVLAVIGLAVLLVCFVGWILVNEQRTNRMNLLLRGASRDGIPNPKADSPPDSDLFADIGEPSDVE